jgi:glycolate oxidase iron-sulfur subunit
MPSPPPRCALPDTPLAAASPGLDACVHCGFCLPACPTYLALDDENDSPRGRLVLMQRLLDGDVAPTDPDLGVHLDRCLGCRACETACPSGVPYGALLEATRATLATARPRPLVARAILALFASPALLRPVLASARALRATGLPRRLAPRLPRRLGFPLAMLAASAPVPIGARPRSARGVIARGATLVPPGSPHGRAEPSGPGQPDAPRRDRPGPAGPWRGPAPVTLLDGCVMDGLFGHVNAATRRVLAANGWTVADATGQRCCGALHAHAGDLETARALARANIAAFEAVGDAPIAVNAAGCGAMLKQYGHLLHDDPAWRSRAEAVAARTRDVSELLATTGPRVGRPVAGLPPVTHDPPCHQMHAQRVVREPLAVLDAIPGLDLRPLSDADQCCGSAGIYNLLEPAVSDAVLAPKLAAIAATGAGVVATGNPGCLMQIGAGLLLSGSPARAVHPVELLDAAYGDAAGTRGGARTP